MWLIVSGIPAGRPVGVPDNHLWPHSGSLRARHVGVPRQAGDGGQDGQIQAELLQVVEQQSWNKAKHLHQRLF